MYRFAFLIVAVTLLTSSTAQADLIYNNVSFANWTGTDGGTSRTGDMTFGGNTVGTVQLEAVSATESFSTAFNSPFINDGRAENTVYNSGLFLARAKTVAGLDPESTIEFKFTVLTLEPNWDLDGISLSSLSSILAGRTLDLSFNDASNLSLSGLSATVDDQSSVDLIAAVGSTPVAFTSGSTITFNDANYDSPHGFRNPTHTKKWGIDMAGASEFTAIYTAGLVSPAGNIQNEQFVFGVQLTEVPEPSTVIPLTTILLGITLNRFVWRVRQATTGSFRRRHPQR